MPLPRLLTLILGIGVILGLMLWLVNALYRLYIEVSYTAPILGILLLLLLIVLLGTLIAAFVYYVGMSRRPSRGKRQRQRPKAPENKADAASENLQAVRKLLRSIQDEVARQALIERSREIEANLARGHVQVTIFGTGSAGKTSIVNALMGRVVGRIDAPMGTTDAGATYALELNDLDREVLITDTPGILEAGTAGTERGELARQLATEADLLLFVVDNDLSQSEYNPLQALAEIGKRSILVLNKADLYSDIDVETILAHLRSRVRCFIAPKDVVAVAANPQPVTLDTGAKFQPEPDIMPLVDRIVAVLREDGEDLIADNILLQSQRLGEETRRLIDSQRRREANKVVERFQWISAGVIAATPLPVVDVLATAAVNAQMVVEIGRVYDCELNFERGRELALSLGKTLASLGIVEGVLTVVSTALKLSIGGYVVGKAIQGVSAAYLTRIAGKSFIEYFRQDQDWGDGGMTEVVQRQYQLARKDEFVKAFIKDAIARVVEPLQQNPPEPTEVEDDSPDDSDGWDNPPKWQQEDW